MNFTLRLTLDGLVGALRMKAHSLADGERSRRPPKSPRPAETESKAGLNGLQKKEERDDLARG